MSKCPFYSEDMISSYVEGLLSQGDSKLFEEHLMECDVCLQSVLDLRNDLFKMGVHEQYNYKGMYLIEAVFLLLKNRLLILRDIGKGDHFKRLQESYKLRGKNINDNYLIRIKDIDIRVGNDSEDKFLIEFHNIKGKFIELFKDRKLVEAHANPKMDELLIRSLDKGEYIIVISEGKSSKDTKKKIERIKIKVN